MRCRCSPVWQDTQSDSVLSILIICSNRRWKEADGNQLVFLKPLSEVDLLHGGRHGNLYKRDDSPMTWLHLSEQKSPNRPSTHPWVFVFPRFPFNSLFFDSAVAESEGLADDSQAVSSITIFFHISTPFLAPPREKRIEREKECLPKKRHSSGTQMDCLKCAGFRFLPSIPEAIREAIASTVKNTRSFFPKQTPQTIYKIFIFLFMSHTNKTTREK